MNEQAHLFHSLLNTQSNLVSIVLSSWPLNCTSLQ